MNRLLPLVLPLALAAPTGRATDRYVPAAPPRSGLEAILQHLAPGQDAFPSEKTAREIEVRLQDLAAALKKRSPGPAGLFATGFRGGRLVPAEPTTVASSSHL